MNKKVEEECAHVHVCACVSMCVGGWIGSWSNGLELMTYLGEDLIYVTFIKTCFQSHFLHKFLLDSLPTETFLFPSSELL